MGTTIAKRRALEAKVIDAARVAAKLDWRFPELRMLRFALDELDAAGLADATNARSRGWPVTSVQAAAWMKGGWAGTVASKIVRRLWMSPCTTEELEERLGGKHQTISARVNELRDAGWIRATDLERKTSSGLRAIVWELTPEAKNQIMEATG